MIQRNCTRQISPSPEKLALWLVLRPSQLRGEGNGGGDQREVSRKAVLFSFEIRFPNFRFERGRFSHRGRKASFAERAK